VLVEVGNSKVLVDVGVLVKVDGIGVEDRSATGGTNVGGKTLVAVSSGVGGMISVGVC